MPGVGVTLGVLEGMRVCVGVGSGVRGVWVSAIELLEAGLRVGVGGALVGRGVFEGGTAVGWAEAVFSRLPASMVIASTVGKYSVG